MIISASRRTDIPAFYSKWFFNRLQEGYCTVPNPFNKNIVSVIDLNPKNVDVFVFWTRNASPLWEKHFMLDERKYDYYFQYTITNYPTPYEKSSHNLEHAINSFQQISEKIGPEKTIWRYDPILFTSDLDYKFHLENFQFLFNKLKNHTKRVVISIVDDYRKTKNRLSNNDIIYTKNQVYHPDTFNLLRHISELCISNGIEVETCAENIDLLSLGIKKGMCIDVSLINSLFNKSIKYKKDPGQRELCLCAQSRDIGVNNTCINGCEYCYATVSQKTAVNNYKKHDPDFSSLYVHEITDNVKQKINDLKIAGSSDQIDLF